jgi:quercetin dioxygenase-like cupin family protein
MRVVTLKDVPEVDLGEATPIAGWTGGPVKRSRQTIIPDGDSDNYRASIVNFTQGSTTGWHAHDCDQILIVTHGSGIVATEQEEREINVGDVVHIKAGEKHWHGAKADTTMGHITITTVNSSASHFQS